MVARPTIGQQHRCSAAGKNALIPALVIVALLLATSNWQAARLLRGQIHGSAIAISLGLLLAYWGGVATGGSNGLADVSFFTGLGVLGGAMFPDFAIVATAFGADLDALKRAGWVGALSVVLGVVLSFAVGAVVAVAFGFSDVVSVSTIGAGAATYIVGPLTGKALGADSAVIALSVAAGLVKAILVMVASWVGLDNPQSALIYGGLMGTTSGVAAGLAAADPKPVP